MNNQKNKYKSESQNSWPEAKLNHVLPCMMKSKTVTERQTLGLNIVATVEVPKDVVPLMAAKCFFYNKVENSILSPLLMWMLMDILKVVFPLRGYERDYVRVKNSYIRKVHSLVG